jgi:hypothetical protein
MILLENLQRKNQQMIKIYILAKFLNKNNNKQGNIKVLMITLF